MNDELTRLREFFSAEGASYRQYLEDPTHGWGSVGYACTAEVRALLAEADRSAGFAEACRQLTQDNSTQRERIAELELRIKLEEIDDHERTAAELVDARARIAELEVENARLEAQLRGELDEVQLKQAALNGQSQRIAGLEAENEAAKSQLALYVKTNGELAQWIEELKAENTKMASLAESRLALINPSGSDTCRWNEGDRPCPIHGEEEP